MPEIAEVYRIVHFIRQSLVGKTVAVARAQEDANVFGKVGTTATEIEKALAGKKIVGAGSQGKYFWLEMASAPHLVLHFGMTGWFYFKDEHTYYYRPKPGEAPAEWPPKFWKFLIETKPEGKAPAVHAAFADARRFGRVRLVHCAGKELRNTTPLKENGPDPYADVDIFTRDWFADKCRSKKIPIKALLLDQANISGIGNWVGDEVLFHARIHPEQYSNTLSDAQLTKLHSSIVYVCKTACDALADSEQFPEDWLFKHRWGKGKKESTNRLPSGEKITFLTVGGRTSAVVPSLQKKTGAVAKDVDENDDDDSSASEAKPKPKAKDTKRKRDAEKSATNGAVKEEEPEEQPAKKGKKGAAAKVKDAAVNGAQKAKANVAATTKSKKPAKTEAKPSKKAAKEVAIKKESKATPMANEGRRRSGRNKA